MRNRSSLCWPIWTELTITWELVLVNDGSLDNSWALAKELSKDYKNLRVVGYSTNQGRGYAIREGVKNARGKIVITTEIDSSWGDDIVSRILVAFQKHPDADIVIASPHLPGGGYKNVPLIRVLLSKYGNFFIRAGLTTSVTMNTGMTRGYRREKFLALPLDENGKEMHLEIVNKAVAFIIRFMKCRRFWNGKTNNFPRNQAKNAVPLPR